MDRLLLGESTPIRRLRTLIRRVSPSSLPVLITGPTGAGKELVAQGLHLLSGRKGKFVAFNVCAVTDTMFEDALFGHVRGAFTGAAGERKGYLAEADGGTLFLDEIGGLPLVAQVKALRAIETREFRPVGAASDRHSDFRLVAASNETLEGLVAAGRFRRDLMYRLGGVVLEVPALRERLDDVALLARHFAAGAETGHHQPVRLTTDALRRLQRHDWPGNVRELRNVVRRAVVLAASSVLTGSDIDAALRGGVAHDSQTWSLERHRLLLALERHGWDTVRAALELGVTRKTVYARLQRYAIEIPLRHRRRRVSTESPEREPPQSTNHDGFTAVVSESIQYDGESS